MGMGKDGFEGLGNGKRDGLASMELKPTNLIFNSNMMIRSCIMMKDVVRNGCCIGVSPDDI